MSSDRIALVTGGAGGLGYSICTKLHEKGYRVVLTHSPSNTTIKETLADMKARGHDFHAYPVDVADYDSAQRCVADITRDVGHIDILINNAGITRDTTFRKMTKGDWDSVVRTNLDSMTFQSGGQGLWSTVDDYLTFARLFLGAGAVDGVRILKPETMEYYQEGGKTRIRQRPGPKNSLGYVKFLFPNDFNIYLHDTPNHELFDKDVRAFSHADRKSVV